jgi:tRNA(Ile)-lysidine synthase
MTAMATTDAITVAPAADLPAALAAVLTAPGFWSAPVLVGVSGGADSVALLFVLRALAACRPAPARLVVAHARHDLRAEAAADAAFVCGLAGRLGLPCVVRDLPVRAAVDVRGEGVEALARRLRMDFLADVAGEHGARHVVVAHTADDQAETILHRILRGTGPAGLRGMAPARELCAGVSLLRPLLSVPRQVVRDYLVSLGQEWREDATNADAAYARNFLRHEILPRCESGHYPAASAALVRLASQVAGLAGAVRSAAEHLLDTVSLRGADGAITIRPAPLAMLDPQLVSEVFVALWCREGWPQRDMTSRHYTLLARMASAVAGGTMPAAVDLPEGVRVTAVEQGELRLEPPAGRARAG